MWKFCTTSTISISWHNTVQPLYHYRYHLSHGRCVTVKSIRGLDMQVDWISRFVEGSADLPEALVSPTAV